EDPRVRALGPRHRAQLRAYRDFMAPGDAPAGARLEEAERRLGEALERELGLGPGVDARRAPLGSRGADGFLAAWLRPQRRPVLPEGANPTGRAPGGRPGAVAGVGDARHGRADALACDCGHGALRGGDARGGPPAMRAAHEGAGSRPSPAKADQLHELGIRA